MSIEKGGETIRILIVTNHYFPENFKINDISYYFQGKFDTTVVTCKPNYPSGRFYSGYTRIRTRVSDNFKIFRLPLISRGNGGLLRLALNYFSYFFSLNVFFILQILCKERFSHILVHHTSPPLLSLPPIYYKIFFPKVRLIYWELDVWPESLSGVGLIRENSFVFKGVLELMRWIYDRYNTILIGSKSYFQVLEGRADSNKIHYFPNWAESSFENYKQSFETDIILPNGFNVVFTGNIGAAQGLSSIPDLLKDINGINFIFLGDGKYRKDLELLCKAKGVWDKVLFMGYKDISELPGTMAKCDLAFLSLNDSIIFKNTVPAKLQAYMAFGMPIFGLISGECNKIINSSGCGIAIEYGDTQGAQKALNFFKTLTKDQLGQYGARGKSFYWRNYAYKLRLQQLEKLLFDQEIRLE